MTVLFPNDDPSLRRRLQRQALGLASYLMFLLPLGYAVSQGWMDFGWAGLWTLVGVALLVNLGFFLAIRSRWSQRFADPSLTFAQIFVAMALALVMIHYGGEVRALLLTLFVASLFFGVFGLSQRGFLLLSACAVGGYLALALWQTRSMPWWHPMVRMEGLRLLTLAMILLWLSLLGSYVAGLRAQLERRNAELDDAMSRLKQLVSHDELTGVFNRRHLMDILAREKERAERFGYTFSLCLLDLDHFKQVNDSHGHGVGDEVLKGFAERMLRGARRIDWVGRQDPPQATDSTFGRFGGEEFLLVLPHTDLAGARRCLDRLRSQVLEEPFLTSAGPLRLSFSAGVTESREGELIADALARADAALYRAKDAGRDRTEFV